MLLCYGIKLESSCLGEKLTTISYGLRTGPRLFVTRNEKILMELYYEVRIRSGRETKNKIRCSVQEKNINCNENREVLDDFIKFVILYKICHRIKKSGSQRDFIFFYNFNNIPKSVGIGLVSFS